MGFSIKSSHFGTGQVFSDNYNLTYLVDVQHLYENNKGIKCVSDRVILCLKNVLVVPHYLFKMFQLQQR